MAWDQGKFDAALSQKYANQTTQVNATAAADRARANLGNQQAAQVAGLAQSQIGLEGAQGKLYGAQAYKTTEEGNMVKPIGESVINQNNANAYLMNEQGSMVKPIGVSTIAQNMANAYLMTEQGSMVRPIGESTIGANDASANASNASANASNANADKTRYDMNHKRGIARVPGKGEGDKVPAMLEPGEAVLNKHAAGMIGRGVISKANAKGNDKRAAETAQKVSKLAQLLKAQGMV